MTTTNVRMVAVYSHRCLKCGFEWESANEHPKVCKACKHYKWGEPPKRRGRPKKEA